MNASLEVRVDDLTQVGQVRRLAHQLAGEAQFDGTDAARAGLVASEIASNIVKHGAGGMVLLRIFDQEGCRWIELLGVDRGAGLRDIPGSLRDGHSTTGTAGTGLGAIRRSSSQFDLYSRPGGGTVVLSRIAAGDSVTPEPSSAFGRSFQAGGVCVALHGESVCGDGWDVAMTAGGMRLIVSDGLGHGAGAAIASHEAVEVFRRTLHLTLAEQLNALHVALRSTRGAAVGLADIDRSSQSLRFVGVGNIAGVILPGGSPQRTVSHNGIVGHEMRKVQEFTYSFPDEALFIAHSDGLSPQWDLGAYPGVRGAHPAIIAALLYRDHARERDDSSVVVLRGGAEHSS